MGSRVFAEVVAGEGWWVGPRRHHPSGESLDEYDDRHYAHRLHHRPLCDGGDDAYVMLRRNAKILIVYLISSRSHL